MLRGHRLDVIELLRFPALKAILNSDTLRDLPYAVLRVAREYLDNAVLRIDVHVEEFYHRHQGTWLTIRGCTRSVLALLGTKLRCDREVGPTGATGSALDPATLLLPPTWRSAVERVLHMLRSWQDESKDVPRLAALVETLLQLC